MTRREFRDLSSPADTRQVLRALDINGGTETVPIDAARGHRLATHVDAHIDVPGFDRAAMDGYAVRAADTFGASEQSPVSLDVTGTVRAGSEPTEGVDAGKAVQVATGAVLPPGANAVVPVERTVENEESVDVTSAVAPGDSVMPRGEDIAAGERALNPGTYLGPRHVGLLSALGKEAVTVQSPPRVAVVSTGEELVQPGGVLRPEAGQIYDVNTHSITAAVEAAGGEAYRYATPSDDPARLRSTLRTATEDCDLVITSGSTSAGAADRLHSLVEEDGDVLVHGVAIKPGRPLLVGRVFGTPYIGLPGYPVSALSVFRTFVSPVVREAAGKPPSQTATSEATMATTVRYDGGRLRLLPVGLVANGDGELLAYSPGKGSGATTTLVETDGVVRMAPQTAVISGGETVTVELFDETPPPTLLGVGDPDPVLSALFETADRTRFLRFSPDDSRRWLEDDIPDVLLTDPELADGSADGELLAEWSREWGLVLPSDGSVDIERGTDVIDGSFRFATLDETHTLRGAFDQYLSTRSEGSGASDVPHHELPGLESPARSVDAGRADVGIGLRATAETLGLQFHELGRQRLTLEANPDRLEKESVRRLETALEDRLETLLDEFTGYESVGE